MLCPPFSFCLQTRLGSVYFFQAMPPFSTPYYLINERQLLHNLKILKQVRDLSGAKSVLALKCFSTWSVFPLMRQYMDGTTSSGVYEARLGREKFGKEVHAYSVGYSKSDILEVARFSDKVIFNSLSQFKRLAPLVRGKELGIRVNPGFSYSHFDLADPARPFSRLGVTNKAALFKLAGRISGIMFHFNCENDDFQNLSANLDRLCREYGPLLKKLDWVSFGGGLFFTKPDYPLAAFCNKLTSIRDRFDIQIYLEPGEAAITGSAELVTTVLDMVHNKMDIAIVDASTEAHMLDHLIYKTTARIISPASGKVPVMIAGRSCLAGDVFGQYKLKTRLKPGSIVRIGDAAGYTMVKKNWFNGMPMPAIVVKRLNGKMEMVRRFDYQDFRNALS